MGNMKGQNLISSKQFNRGLLLKLIATGVCNKRVELAKLTKLSKMTVTNIVSEFISQGLVTECEEELTDSCGRNPILLKISEKAPKLMGLLIFRGRIEAVLCDLSMNFIHREAIPFETLTRETLLEYSFQAVDRLLQREKNVLGLGVAVIGPVDVQKGILINPPRFYGIQNVPLLELLRQRYGFPVYLDHDNNSAALAEKLFGIGRDLHDFLFMGITANCIGSGIISNGEIYHNHRGVASELGHISIDRSGPKCYCGSRGCLELYAGTESITKKLREATGRPLSYPQFFELEGDPTAEQILEEMLEDISIALAGVVNLLQPEMIILGEDCIDWKDRHVARLEELINEKRLALDHQKLLVRKSLLGKEAQLAGAAAILADHVFRGEVSFSRQ